MFLIEAGDRLVLVDAGLKDSPPRITEAIYSLGRLPQDVAAIVVTHAHPDHVGGLAEMKRRTGAEVWMHPADAALVSAGVYGRPFGRGRSRASDVLRRALNAMPRVQGRVGRRGPRGRRRRGAALRRPARLHTPGHTAGHLALLLPREGGVLFVGDAASNMLRTGLSPLNEDLAEPGRSLRKLAALEFEVACFAHGRVIRSKASKAFRELARRLEQAGPPTTPASGGA